MRKRTIPCNVYVTFEESLHLHTHFTDGRRDPSNMPDQGTKGWNRLGCLKKAKSLLFAFFSESKPHMQKQKWLWCWCVMFTCRSYELNRIKSSPTFRLSNRFIMPSQIEPTASQYLTQPTTMASLFTAPETCLLPLISFVTMGMHLVLVHFPVAPKPTALGKAPLAKREAEKILFACMLDFRVFSFSLKQAAITGGYLRPRDGFCVFPLLLAAGIPRIGLSESTQRAKDRTQNPARSSVKGENQKSNNGQTRGRQRRRQRWRRRQGLWRWDEECSTAVKSVAWQCERRRTFRFSRCSFRVSV
jgi:hypothetical protein